MAKMGLLTLLAVTLLLNACSKRMGYEMIRQMEYQECIKTSRHPAEECQDTPDFDEYQLEKELRYPEPNENQ